jgi:hypothetical protein
VEKYWLSSLLFKKKSILKKRNKDSLSPEEMVGNMSGFIPQELLTVSFSFRTPTISQQSIGIYMHLYKTFHSARFYLTFVPTVLCNF